MSLRDNTERHLFYKDIYKHRGYAYTSTTRIVVYDKQKDTKHIMLLMSKVGDIVYQRCFKT